jgi:integrase
MQRLKPSSQLQYRYAFGHFAQWLHVTRQQQQVDAAALDAQLEAFAEHLFRTTDGRRRQTAACARLACIWLAPHLKHALPRSLAVTNPTAWNRAANRIVRSHPPIPWPLLCVVAHQYAAAGDHAMATAVIVAFGALLRVGEVARLRVCDVAEQRHVDARLRDGLVLTIHSAKTADPMMGEQQSVLLRDAVVIALLRDFVAARRAAARPTDSLFGRSKHALEHSFTAAAAALGGAVHFTWHSLRHGGATFMAMSDVPVEDICIHGRWQSLAGVRRYIQTGQAVVAAHGVDRRVVARGESIAAALRMAFPTSD